MLSPELIKHLNCHPQNGSKGNLELKSTRVVENVHSMTLLLWLCSPARTLDQPLRIASTLVLPICWRCDNSTSHGSTNVETDWICDVLRILPYFNRRSHCAAQTHLAFAHMFVDLRFSILVPSGGSMSQQSASHNDRLTTNKTSGQQWLCVENNKWVCSGTVRLKTVWKTSFKFEQACFAIFEAHKKTFCYCSDLKLVSKLWWTWPTRRASPTATASYH